jgi:DNA-binding transcriptional MocR family regulator
LAPFQQGQSSVAGSVTLKRVATAHLLRLLGDWRDGGPAYAALAAGLRALIVEGRLPPYTRLPSERAAATALGVSRNTVTAALDLLRDHGYLTSHRGTGSWVSLPRTSRDRPDEPLPIDGDVIDLTVASLPAPPELARLALAAATSFTRELSGHGYDPFGVPATRAAVADYLTAHGLATEPAQVLITQGALHAWDLALRTLAQPGDRILVESPTYPAALDAVRAHGCVPVAIPIGPDGWDLGFMRAVLRDVRPRLGYLIPDFQNPTGVRISAEQRAIAAREARVAGVLLVSDESLAELWYEPEPLPPSLAHGDLGSGVLAVGSLSKPVWGGLRTGWVRATPELVRRFALARSSQDVAGPVLDQLLAAEVLAEGDRLFPARRAMVRERRDALLDALSVACPSWRVTRPTGGMSTWVELPDGTSSSVLAARAIEHGVRVAPGARFSDHGGFEQRLRLPFSQPPERLREAVRRLAAVERALGSSSASPLTRLPWVA